MRSALLALFLIPMTLAAAGCGRDQGPPETLTLATTTGTVDSGLLDLLLPAFRRGMKMKVEVRVVAADSGQALELGRRGEADAILSHSPSDEEAFMAEGWGESRRPVMHNDFVIVGPEPDPAHVRGMTSAASALAAIAKGRFPFVSRGDDSGTHRKERQAWEAAGIEPSGDWYIRAGAGMAEVLRMADRNRAYTLTDRPTYLARRETTELALLAEGDPMLLNPYSVIVVNPKKHPRAHVNAARRFAAFLVSPEGRRAIARYGVERYGRSLFVPDEETSGRPR